MQEIREWVRKSMYRAWMVHGAEGGRGEVVRTRHETVLCFDTSNSSKWSAPADQLWYQYQCDPRKRASRVHRHAEDPINAWG